jgi:acyl carrier protein
MPGALRRDIGRRLKGIWLEILQVDEVDDDASFFSTGGNSLKATLLIARIRDEFGVDVSVQNFFRQPSPRAVARLIATESNDGAAREAPDFMIVPRDKYRVQLSGADS